MSEHSYFSLLLVIVSVFSICAYFLKVERDWKSMSTAIAITSGIFLALNVLLVGLDIIGYNDKYVTGVYWDKLPLEIYALRIIAPLGFLLVYTFIRNSLNEEALYSFRLPFIWFFLLTSIILLVYFYPRLLTSVSFLVGALVFSYQLLVAKSKWLGRFILTIGLLALPIFGVDAFLYGGFTDHPIIWTSVAETADVSFLHIPVEQFVLTLSFYLLLTAIFERSSLRNSH